MSVRKLLIFPALALSGLLFKFGPGENPAPAPSPPADVVQGELKRWTSFEGVLKSRMELPITSALSHRAAITYLVPEGSEVAPGDLLAEFDQTDLQRELFKLEKEAILARAEFESLEKAELPMQVTEIESRLTERQTVRGAEQQYLEDSRKLQARDLVSPQEIEQQERKMAQLNQEVEALEKKLLLTRAYIHPSRLTRARASREAAERALELARSQLAGCRITASRPGLVVYQPVHIDNEYRTLRAGDTVYRNQKFMMLADMTDLVVHCLVPESQLSRVGANQPAEITPAAFPGMRLEGRVEQVSVMAQSISGRPAWQKFFKVTVGLEESDPRLRSGMSVFSEILSYHKRSAVLIPRNRVFWQEDQPYCRLIRGDAQQVVALQLGQSNATHFEVIKGLQPGDQVARP